MGDPPLAGEARTSAEGEIEVEAEDALEAESDLVAAVDLGSNSFHMIIARTLEPDVRIIDRMRDPVQLGAGLDRRRHLTPESQERALEVLRRFGQRLRDMPAARVRAVGTNTLRRAKNARPFLNRARAALGHPIEVVSGREEARLIYLGVAHNVSDEAYRRLVIDIGGGSTECIVGEHFEALQEESLHMGCISFTQRFFPTGELTREAFRQAELAAHLELQTMERRFRAFGWDSCVGASGTILSVEEVCRTSGWCEGGLTRQALRKLRKALVAAGSVRESLQLPGLKPERAPIIPGGLAILTAVFEALEIDRMHVSLGALREGLLYDLLGRIRHEDVRDRTIRRFEERYHVDREQAARVERTALSLLRQAAVAWKLKRDSVRLALLWAARLHEIGLALAYSSYHKHGAYLVTHSDMPGFSMDEQRLLAALIRCHRRKLSRDLLPDYLSVGPERLLRLCILLRLAVLLNRGRSPRPLPELALSARKGGLELAVPAEWLAKHPLTAADLEEEARLLAVVGYELRVTEKP